MEVRRTQKDIQICISQICDEVKDLLITKNNAYGSSFLYPERTFSKADALEQINVRMDDKLSRIATLTGDPTITNGDETINDTKRDLIGYLILEQVAHALLIK